MTTEKIIMCPKSGGDLCIETQLNPEVTTYMSLSCGFWSNSLMKEGEEFHEKQMLDLPELYKDLAWTDPETNLVWIPNTINLQEQGMVFAYGPNKDSWGWGAAKAIQEDGKWKMDLANMVVFPERDYIEALSFIGILPE
jgi:hypothetical protein